MSSKHELHELLNNSALEWEFDGDNAELDILKAWRDDLFNKAHRLDRLIDRLEGIRDIQAQHFDGPNHNHNS